ncbi:MULTISPECIES: hypothetical protein [Rhizobium/Agrobacterium group]|uniref:hypothetical protein n=1 Tax=Rhizobium/Agrobacterium group TaxID=227290 RepID=UPI001F384A76|nr:MULTISPECIES: hypothetical protein [Rhizobium/Agrobacterium group]
MSTTVTPGIAYAYGYSSTKAAEADTEFMASLPDDSQPKTALQVEMEAMWAEGAAIEAKIEAESKPRVTWAILQIGNTPVTIDTEGGVSYSGSELDIDIDWENLNTAEERAEAIMSKYGGTLTTSAVESGDKSLTSELMSKMFSSDALVDRMLMTSSGESLQEGLLSSDEDANGAQASASTTSAASTPQVQSTAA